MLVVQGSDRHPDIWLGDKARCFGNIEQELTFWVVAADTSMFLASCYSSVHGVCPVEDNIGIKASTLSCESVSFLRRGYEGFRLGWW